jgi:hypothetical protein
MVQLSATKYSSIAIIWVSLVSFAAITLCVASQRVFIAVSVYFFMTQSGNFWIHPRICIRFVNWVQETRDDVGITWDRSRLEMNDSSVKNWFKKNWVWSPASCSKKNGQIEPLGVALKRRVSFMHYSCLLSRYMQCFVNLSDVSFVARDWTKLSMARMTSDFLLN